MTEHKPAAWQWLDTANFRKHLPPGETQLYWRPLYAHPPALRMPEPMTDGEMMRALGNLTGLDLYDVWRRAEAETLRRVQEANK